MAKANPVIDGFDTRHPDELKDLLQGESFQNSVPNPCNPDFMIEYDPIRMTLKSEIVGNGYPGEWADIKVSGKEFGMEFTKFYLGGLHKAAIDVFSSEDDLKDAQEEVEIKRSHCTRKDVLYAAVVNEDEGIPYEKIKIQFQACLDKIEAKKKKAKN